jgi:hypothetical protein
VMGEEIFLGVGMMLVTTSIQAMFMVGGFRVSQWKVARFGRAKGEAKRAVLISVFTAWMFLAIVMETWLWALLYRVHPGISALPDLGTAFYFSMVTFTSLGYGDIVLSRKWRTLAPIQAANGVIIFGWTTALIFEFIQRMYRNG